MAESVSGRLASRRIAGREGTMTRVWPVADEGLGNSSYLAEVADGVGLIVDPGRDPRPYLDLAAAHGLRIAFAADTHVHADFVSGGRELAGLGARLLAPAESGLAFGHEGWAGAGSGRPDPAGTGHARAHPGAPGLPAARRESAGGGVYRRCTGSGVTSATRPAGWWPG